MLKTSKKAGDEEALPPLPTDEGDRDLELFRRWMRGSTFEELAAMAGISLTQVYRVCKAKNWKKWERRRKERDYRHAALELDRESNREDRAQQFVKHRGRLGEWIESVATFPSCDELPLGYQCGGSPDVEIVEANPKAGFVKLRSFFEGGYKSPFRRGPNREPDET